MDSAENQKAPTSPRAILLLLLVAAGALRAWCSLDEFWIDEIWSWDFARRADSPQQFFAGPSLDNNHPLNSLWMWTLGDVLFWPLYRLPALALGTATVGLAWVWGARTAGERGVPSPPPRPPHHHYF